jgi:type III pantothenate kinase
MILTIDIGNTNTDIGIFENEKIIKYEKIRTCNLLKYNWKILRKYEIDKILAISVVSGVINKFKKIIKKQVGLFPKIISSQYNIDMKINYNRKLLGADRMLACYAVKKLYGYPAIVVNFGTATTVDIVSSNGEYIGGAIFPGINMCIDALYEKTSKLPRIKFSFPQNFIGKNTKSCINIGIAYSAIESVKLIIEKIKKKIKKKVLVIGTGGAVKLINKKIKFDYIDEFLILKGLNIIGGKYILKSGSER